MKRSKEILNAFYRIRGQDQINFLQIMMQKVKTTQIISKRFSVWWWDAWICKISLSFSPVGSFIPYPIFWNRFYNSHFYIISWLFFFSLSTNAYSATNKKRLEIYLLLFFIYTKSREEIAEMRKMWLRLQKSVTNIYMAKKIKKFVPNGKTWFEFSLYHQDKSYVTQQVPKDACLNNLMSHKKLILCFEWT